MSPPLRFVPAEFQLESRFHQPSVLNRALSPPHEVPEFTVTSYGVRARLPIITIYGLLLKLLLYEGRPH